MLTASSTVTHVSREMVLLLNISTSTITLNKEVLILTGILPGEETRLTLSFTIFFDSLLWSWTFTFSKLLHIFEAYNASIISNRTLRNKVWLLVLLLLACQCLLKLHLLVNFLLLIG